MLGQCHSFAEADGERTVSPSNVHVYYVVAEGIKMVGLLVLGVRSFR